VTSLAGVLALGGLSALGLSMARLGPSEPPIDLPRVPVVRTDLDVSIRAGGEVDSAQKTLIECELEQMSYYNEGRSITARGTTTIIELIPDGSQVKKGDVLARLDASDYEELVRQQTIEVEESRAELRQAELEHEACQVRLREYNEGLLGQLKEQYAARIALAEADHTRQQDRTAWTHRMVDLNYLPGSRGTFEDNNLMRTQITLDTARLSLSNLLKFGAPKAVAALEAWVYSAGRVKNFTELRLKRHLEQLADYKEQVERCTIRAPHDGFLVYANDDDGDTRIETGASVYQKQDLFYLPDLSQMEVLTALHETVVDRVREGMHARVRVEAFPHVTIEGHVVAVAPLPDTTGNWMKSREVKNYIGKVKLDSIPDGLRPGMSAEVEIVTAHRPDALVVPPTALATTDDGREVCYVTTGNHIERREIQVGEVTSDMIEVVAGLDAGEEILADPSQLDPSIQPPLIPLTEQPRLAGTWTEPGSDPSNAQPAL
jgi:HlyD family secretion protein